MCWRLLLCAAAALLTASCTTASSARASIDFSGIDAWLRCAKGPHPELARCAESSSATTGGQIATLAQPSFGPSEPPREDVQPALVGALVRGMKVWADPIERAQQFFAPPVGGGPVQVFVVANGHPWGDAYVTSVAFDGRAPRLSDEGEPVIVLNAARIASSYRGTPAEQAAAAHGVLAHELFHALFRRFRASEPGWKARSFDAPLDALALTVLNEGVAHFVDRGPRLAREGLPAERAGAALAALSTALEALRGLGPDSAEAEAIVRSASQGPYWEKFGSVAGMLLTWGISRAFGAEGVRDAVRCGPGRLVARYGRAAEQLADLPPLPDAVRALEHLNLCAGLEPRR